MRALRRSLIALAVLAVLFVAADRVAVNLAEEKAASKIKSSQGLSGTESATVDIHGFPFLTQVLSRDLDRVDIELTGMTAAAAGRQIPVTRLEATLSDVHLGEGYSSATAERAEGTADISYADLNKIAPKGVEVSYAGKERAARNQVKITASIDVMGRTLEIPAAIYSTVRIGEDDRVRLQADKVPGTSIPGAAEQVRQHVDFGTSVRGLPSGLTLQKADVTKTGVRFTVAGTDVPLG